MEFCTQTVAINTGCDISLLLASIFSATFVMFVLFILCAYTEACNNMQYVQYRLLSLYSYVSGVFTYNLLLCYNLFLMFLAVHAPIRLLTQFSIFWHNIYFLMLLFLVLHNYLCVFFNVNKCHEERIYIVFFICSPSCMMPIHSIATPDVCRLFQFLCHNFKTNCQIYVFVISKNTSVQHTLCVLLSPSLLLLMTTNCAVSAMFLVTVQTISILCLF